MKPLANGFKVIFEEEIEDFKNMRRWLKCKKEKEKSSSEKEEVRTIVLTISGLVLITGALFAYGIISEMMSNRPPLLAIAILTVVKIILHIPLIFI
jgi:hypothetical protein